MSEQREPYVALWLRQAEEDLGAAAALLEDEASPPRLPCFLAHLAAEKSIKALLIAAGRPVPKIHDLAELVRGLPPSLQEQLDRRELETLTPWAIAGRYADDLAETDATTARFLLQAAGRVLEVARASIGAEG